MRKSILFLASAALLFAGCAKVEDEAPITEKGKRVVTLKASIDGDDTRVSVETDGTYKWQSGDKIGVWVVDTDGGATYPYTTEDSGTSANFTVALDDGEALGEYAFYPYSEDHFVSGEGPRFALDANLQYVEDATNMPMLGTVSGGTISFKSVGGVIKLTVNNIPSDAAHLLFSAKDLNGDNLFISGVFPISGDQITAGGIMGVNTVIINFTGKRQNSMVFYVPLPTGTYGGFEIEFDNANSSETLASKKVNFGSTGLKVHRNEIILAPALSLTPSQLIPDGVYAIALMNESHLNKDIMMTASTGHHQTYSDLGTIDANGKVSVSAISAWRFVYDANNSTYTIMSMSENKYLQGNAGSTDLKFATTANEIAHYTITSEGVDSDNNAIYKILVRDDYDNERWIGVNYNSGSPLFGMYNQTTYPGSLCLIPAIINDQTPSITFDSEVVTVPASSTSTTFYYTAEHITVNPTVVVATDDDSIVSSVDVDATNNQIVVSLYPNEDDFAKTATLTVSCSGVSDITLTINQNGKNAIVQDVLTKALIGVSGSGYDTWTDKTYPNGSGAVYAGCSSGRGEAYNCIQLKSADKISGIVSTTSGGKVKTISVIWDDYTTSGRTLNVYGKNSAYTSASDLYDSSKQGTLLGTIVYGTSTELTITGDYEFVGLRSNSGAMYLTEIEIDWEPESGSGPGPEPTTYAVSWTNPTEAGCTISASVNGNSIQSGSSFAQGTVVTITATAGEGFTFSEWTINGAQVASSTTATTTFTVGTSPVSFNASFTSDGGGTGDTETYRHVFTAKPSVGNNVTLSGISWNITATNLGSYNSNNYAGVQIGTSNKDGRITLTSSSEWSFEEKTKITEVRLWLNRGGTSVTPAVTIGGKSAISDGTVVVKNSSAGNDWTKATKVTFTPATDGDTGVVVIDVQSVNAGYICAIEIDCE